MLLRPRLTSAICISTWQTVRKNKSPFGAATPAARLPAPHAPGSDALPSGRSSPRIAAPSSAAWRAGHHPATARLGTECVALGAAPDHSTMGCCTLAFFLGVPPASWTPALSFHMTSPKIPSLLIKLPESSCKASLRFIQCTYEQIYAVCIAVHTLENTQEPR
jgi:hypothetical protein